MIRWDSNIVVWNKWGCKMDIKPILRGKDTTHKSHFGEPLSGRSIRRDLNHYKFKRNWNGNMDQLKRLLYLTTATNTIRIGYQLALVCCRIEFTGRSSHSCLIEKLMLKFLLCIFFFLHYVICSNAWCKLRFFGCFSSGKEKGIALFKSQWFRQVMASTRRHWKQELVKNGFA